MATEAEFCMSCGREFIPTPERECHCIGCGALGRIANLGGITAASIVRKAFEEMRAVAKARYSEEKPDGNAHTTG